MAFAIGKKLEGVFFPLTSVFHCLPILKMPLSSAGEAELTRCRPSSVLPTDSSLNPESACLGFPYFSMVGESSREG